MSDPRKPQPASMTLSREQLQPLDTEWVAVQQVRVRRRIVSETVQVTVTVRREELVFATTPMRQEAVAVPLDYVPPLVVILREEVPVINMATRPYEQVTVSVVQVAGEQTVSVPIDSESVQLLTDDPA